MQLQQKPKILSMYAFEVWHKDYPERKSIINAQSAPAARFRHYLQVSDAWNEVSYLDFRCRKAGSPVTTDRLTRTAEYRDVPFAKGGMKVKVGEHFGLITDGNSSANFDVLFTTGPNAGIVFNCHPLSKMTYYNDLDEVIATF